MRKNIAFFVIAICIFLMACSAQQASPTFVPSSTPLPSSTIMPSPTQIPSRTPAPTHTPEPTYPPYPTKQVLIEYSLNGDHGFFDDLVASQIPKLILYTDRQLVISGSPFREKILSKAEINSLLSQLETRGLYTIQTNQKHDSSDPLYNFGKNYQEIFDGLFLCLLVHSEKPRTLCAYQPLQDFLIPAMKNLLLFLDVYSPGDMSVYRSDRILLDISTQSDSFPEGERPIPVAWPVTLPSLKTSFRMYAEGETAEEIFALFDHSATWKIFIENGVEYSVLARPVLPHETLSQP